MNLQTYLMIKKAATYNMSIQGSNQVHPAAIIASNGDISTPQEVYNQYATLGPGEKWSPRATPMKNTGKSVPSPQQVRPVPHSNTRMIPPPIVPGRPQQMQQQQRYQPQQQMPMQQRPTNSRRGQLQSYSTVAPGADEFISSRAQGRPQQMQQQQRYQPQQQMPMQQRPVSSSRGQLQSYSTVAPGAEEFL